MSSNGNEYRDDRKRELHNMPYHSTKENSERKSFGDIEYLGLTYEF